MLLRHERFLEEGFGHSESETSRARKSGRADQISSSSDKATAVSEVVGQGKLGPPANKMWIEKWRKDLKIAGVCCLIYPFFCLLGVSDPYSQRQFHRLVEMLVLLKLDPTDQVKLRAYRLQVKERLYRFNFVSHHSFFFTNYC
jgi:histone acetyltransferase 1